LGEFGECSNGEVFSEKKQKEIENCVDHISYAVFYLLDAQM